MTGPALAPVPLAGESVGAPIYVDEPGSEPILVGHVHAREPEGTLRWALTCPPPTDKAATRVYLDRVLGPDNVQAWVCKARDLTVLNGRHDFVPVPRDEEGKTPRPQMTAVEVYATRSVDGAAPISLGKLFLPSEPEGSEITLTIGENTVVVRWDQLHQHYAISDTDADKLLGHQGWEPKLPKLLPKSLVFNSTRGKFEERERRKGDKRLVVLLLDADDDRWENMVPVREVTCGDIVVDADMFRHASPRVLKDLGAELMRCVAVDVFKEEGLTEVQFSGLPTQPATPLAQVVADFEDEAKAKLAGLTDETRQAVIDDAGKL